MKRIVVNQIIVTAHQISHELDKDAPDLIKVARLFEDIGDHALVALNELENEGVLIE